MVIDHGAVPIFVKLLSAASDDVREQVNFYIFHIENSSSLVATQFKNRIGVSMLTVIVCKHLGCLGFGKYCW